MSLVVPDIINLAVASFSRRTQLYRKLQEYEGRGFGTEITERLNQEGRILEFWKFKVLDRLLESEVVTRTDFSQEMAAAYPTVFNQRDLDKALAIINDYVLTGGQNVEGGTGLKKVE